MHKKFAEHIICPEAVYVDIKHKRQYTPLVLGDREMGFIWLTAVYNCGLDIKCLETGFEAIVQ